MTALLCRRVALSNAFPPFALFGYQRGHQSDLLTAWEFYHLPGGNMGSAHDLARDITYRDPFTGADFHCHVSPKGSTHEGRLKDCTWCHPLTDGDRGVFLTPDVGMTGGIRPKIPILSRCINVGPDKIEAGDMCYQVPGQMTTIDGQPVIAVRKMTSEDRRALDAANRASSPWAEKPLTNAQIKALAKWTRWMQWICVAGLIAITAFTAYGLLLLADCCLSG